MKIKKAIIPAAGLGTRFLPLTKAIPKEMIPVLDKPVIQYIVEEAIDSGIEEILIITNRGKESIENYFDISYELEDNLKKRKNNKCLKLIESVSNLKNIYFLRQKKTKGLGHAICSAESFVKGEPFAVLLGDDLFYNKKKPCLKQLIEQFYKKNSTIFALLKVLKNQVNKYGIIEGEKINKNLYKIFDLEEKPSIKKAKSNLAIMGRYIFTPKIFEMIKKTNYDKNQEIQITNAMKKLIEHENIYGYIFEGKRYDIGYLLGYLEATIDLALKRKDLNVELKKLIKKY